jgi:hypothetical protein
MSYVVLLFSLSVHESAHAWTAFRQGDPTALLLALVMSGALFTVLSPVLDLVVGLLYSLVR